MGVVVVAGDAGGILGVGVDDGVVGLARGEEVEFDGDFAGILVGDAADVPDFFRSGGLRVEGCDGVGDGIDIAGGVADDVFLGVGEEGEALGGFVEGGDFGLAGGDDVVAGFGVEVDAGVPVDGDVFDELEGVEVGLVMLGEVGGHLEGGVEGDVESQLVADGVLHFLAPRDYLAHVGFEDTGCVVHGAALQAGEGEDGSVAGMDAFAELGTHGAFVAYHVGPCAAEARGAYCLVGVDHDMVLGGLDDGVVIVVVDGLAVVPFGKGDDGADVAALDGVVAVLVHEGVGFFHPAFVVDGGGAAFVVHDEADAFLVGIAVQGGQVEIGVGGEEVEDEVFLFAVPVFPADVPAFDEECVEASRVRG